MASASRYLSIPLPNGSRISLLLSLPFALIHVAALLIFFIPFHWYYLVTCLVLLVVRMFFVTAGYHRYFSHRSFKTSRVFQFVIAFMAMTSSQKGVLWWAAHHRHHHRHSDQELDLHSPTLFGFFWSHVGWIISDKYNDTRIEYIADFAKFPELRWLNKYHSATPRVTGGTMWYLFSQRSSGNFAKSAIYSMRVSLYLSEMIQPTCDQKNPKSVGECKSSSWSECR